MGKKSKAWRLWEQGNRAYIEVMKENIRQGKIAEAHHLKMAKLLRRERLIQEQALTCTLETILKAVQAQGKAKKS